jgi:hypothetical protein
LPGVPVPALFELRYEALDPAQNGRMRDGQATLGHDLNQISRRQLVAQVPTYTQNNNFPFKVPTLEQVFHALALCQMCKSLDFN